MAGCGPRHAKGRKREPPRAPGRLRARDSVLDIGWGFGHHSAPLRATRDGGAAGVENPVDKPEQTVRNLSIPAAPVDNPPRTDRTSNRSEHVVDSTNLLLPTR